MTSNLDLLELGVGGSHLPPNLVELQNDSTSKEGIYYSTYMYKRFHCHMFCFQVLFNWRTLNYKESTSKRMPSQTSIMHILSKHRYMIIRMCLFLTNSLCNLPFTISTHPNVQICIFPRWSNNKIHCTSYYPSPHLATLWPQKHHFLALFFPKGPRYIGQIIVPIAF